LYTEYVKNPDALIHVDVRGDSNDVRPKRKGPKGPRKPMERPAAVIAFPQ
jgi:hypothetical protein